MPVGVSRRHELNRLVDSADERPMAFGEESSSDDLLVTILRSEFRSGLTNPFPPTRNRAEIQVRETPALRPNSGIEQSNDDVGAVVGVGPETVLVSQAEKLRRASCVEVSPAILEGSEDGRVLED